MTHPSRRVLLQPAFLLHQRPYRETGRILELLARDLGRVTLFARGVRRAGSPFLPVLQPFNRLLVSWSGRGEAGQFMHAEFDGVVASLPPACLLSGFYLNELLLRLLAQHDAMTGMFELYDGALTALRAGENEARTLRVFEKRLLEALGYGLTLDRESASGSAVDPGSLYRFHPGQGLRRVDGVAEGGLIVSGSSLLALAREELDDHVVRSDARNLLRAALEHCLDGRELKSRDVARAVRQLKSPGGF